MNSANMPNLNTPEYLEKLKTTVIQNLRTINFAPSVQMMDVPRSLESLREDIDNQLSDLDEDGNKDKRHTPRQWDKHIERGDGLISDSEDEEDDI